MKFILLMLGIFIVGCGGSGEPEQESVTDTQVAIENASDVTSENSAADGENTDVFQSQMENLEVNAEFDLSTDFQLTFIVSPDTFNQRVFINVCALESITQVVEHEQCLLRTSVSQAGGQFELVVPNSQSLVVAEVWYLTGEDSPILYYWQPEQQPTTFEFMIP